MWERRYRLGMAAARKIEEEEKARAKKVTHPISAEYRGIGIRIEDDVVITAGGCEVLTAGRRRPSRRSSARARSRPA